jgi:hypothetical protein
MKGNHPLSPPEPEGDLKGGPLLNEAIREDGESPPPLFSKGERFFRV